MISTRTVCSSLNNINFILLSISCIDQMNLKQTKKTRPAQTIKGSANLNPLNSQDKQTKGLLKDEQSKIQSKLEALRAEIAERKNIKNKDQEAISSNKGKSDPMKTNTGSRWRTTGPIDQSHMEKFLTSTQQQKMKGSSNQEEQKLEQVLKNLKMEKFYEILVKQKKIMGISILLEKDEEEIDEWKDIPVGFRIKLKKLIKEHRQQSESTVTEKEGVKEEMNIEDIISKRKQSRVFEPIMNKQMDECEEIDEACSEGGHSEKQEEKREDEGDEEDLLMHSLNMAFLGRKGIMRNSSFMQKEEKREESVDSSCKKEVKWGENVQNYKSEDKVLRKSSFKTTKYPSQQLRQKINQEEDKNENKWEQISSKPNVSYCWSCLKRVQPKNQIRKDKRSFCTQNCKSLYQQSIQLKQFQEQAQKLEKQLCNIEEKQKEKKDNNDKDNNGNENEKKNRNIYEVDDGDFEEQFIDLGIN